MGACAGKKKKPKQSTSNEPEPGIKDNNSKPNSSSILPQNSSITNGTTVNTDNANRTASIKDDGIQLIIDEQKKISDVITKPLPLRVVSATDTEVEYELATLVYGNPENEYAENPPTATTFKSTEV